MVKGRKGVSEHVIWLSVAMIVAIITVVLLYVMFPRSDCDRLAKLSAENLKNAIECAAGTGQTKCSTSTIVQLCQENSATVYGVNFISTYMGLSVPQYMIYYQKFPAQSPEGLLGMDLKVLQNIIFGGEPWFPENYPFTRATVGQRPWDLRPTLTQFKYFFKLKYLEDPCTKETALCFNNKGQEEIIRMSIPDIDKVRLERDGMGIAEKNPTFYLVAPCYARVKFEKKNANEIYGTVDLLSTSSSNYCIASDWMLQGVQTAFAAEVSCEILDTAVSIASGGSKAAAQQGIKEGAKIGTKAMVKVVAKSLIRKIGMSQGVGAKSKILQLIFGVVPCVDADWCRGLVACGESLMWPGAPFLELIPENMKGGKSIETATEILLECCNYYRPGNIECPNMQDPEKIICENPSNLVELLKPELTSKEEQADTVEEKQTNTNEGEQTDTTEDVQGVTLNSLMEYLGIKDETHLTNLCNLANGINSKTCQDSIEVRKSYPCEAFPKCWIGANGESFQNHTYNFSSEENKGAKKISIYYSLNKENCKPEMSVEISSDYNNWKTIDERTADLTKKYNYYVIEAPQTEGKFDFKYLRISDKNKECFLDFSSVVLDPLSEDVINTETGKKYDLYPNKIYFFKTPDSYLSRAGMLCKSIKYCVSIYDPLFNKRFVPDFPNTNDFTIGGNMEIHIQVEGKSSVEFKEE